MSAVINTSAGPNNVKGAPRELDDGRKVLWLCLYDSDRESMAVSIETMCHTPEQMNAAVSELREKLGQIF